MTDVALVEDLGTTPILFVAIELGALPDVESASDTLGSIVALFEAAKDGLGTPPGEGERRTLREYDGTQEKRESLSPFKLKRRSRLHLQRMSLASPLEVVLTVLTNKSAPVAYAVTAFWLLERSVRLLMDWQRHRADLERSGQTLDALSDVVARMVVEQRRDLQTVREREGSEELLVGQLREQLARPLHQIASAGEILRVERE
jgi:hypothetical protein